MRAVVALVSLLAMGFVACRRDEASPAISSLRLVDLYQADNVVDRQEVVVPVRLEWRFDGPAPQPAPAEFAATRGWRAGPGVGRFEIRDGLLTARSTTEFPLLDYGWSGAEGNLDTVHAVEVKLRASRGGSIALDSRRGEKVDLAEVAAEAKDWPWDMTAKLAPGGEMQTLTVRPLRPVSASGFRHLLLRPTDASGAEIAIESVRLILRREHLASIPSGLGWQGLSQIYRETLVARVPEALRFDLDIGERAFLDLAIGTVDDGPVEFRVDVAGSTATAEGETLLRRTVTTPHRWEPVEVDLASYAGKAVTLRLSLDGGKGAIGFWGAPVVRTRRAADEDVHTAGVGAAPAGERPQGVIVVWTDTLRRDHLSAYGYARDTSPQIARLAQEGTRFDRCISQATWTKVATPSLLTSLYPTTHGVTDFSMRLPAAATTLAEIFRGAGYATLSMSSILFTGQFTNLHQGFEVLHEDMSLPDRDSSKTARIYVDRLLPWLDGHRDVPFFVFLHVSDPHDPYEPAPPYNAMWNDLAGKERHERENKEVRKVIEEPLLKAFGMPNRAELEKAGFDADAYVDYDRGWYDGSIRAMDVELGRLRERLVELGLDRRTLLVLVGDHGEEFLEHGRTFHGQTAYGELSNVPLILWRPGSVPAGKTVGEIVETIDVMPTILEAVGLETPTEAQGRSFLALAGGAGGAWRPRPAFTEKHITLEPVGAPPPLDTESFAIVDGDWKLIHNTVRPRGGPEYELYDAALDPLDRQDLATKHPDIVARLRDELAAWRRKTEAARLPKEENAAGLSPEEQERLRSLGYLQ